MIHVTRIPAFADNYIWLLNAAASGEFCVVDPGDAEPVIAAVNASGGHLSSILVTHHHGDHCGGVATLKAHYGATIYGPAAESIPTVDVALVGGETIKVDAVGEVQVMSLPGHTRGHLGYLTHSMLFCGDVLFGCGCGRLFEGSAAQMWQSLQCVMALADDTALYCAHEYTLANLHFALWLEPDSEELTAYRHEVATRRHDHKASVPLNLAREKRCNPFLRGNDAALQKRVAQLTQTAVTDALSCFTQVRRLKDQFKA